MLKNEERCYVFLNDTLVDVTDYMWEHPGGTFLLKFNKGKDITGQFYGSPIIGRETHHFHSNYAQLVLSTLIVGKLLSADLPFSEMRVSSSKPVNVDSQIKSIALSYCTSIPLQHHRDVESPLMSYKDRLECLDLFFLFVVFQQIANIMN